MNSPASNATEELRDARRANLEVKISLQTIAEKLCEVTIVRGDRSSLEKAATFAIRELNAALEYLNAAHDAHCALGRLLKDVELA